ncbi:hypothetical protein Leryth_022797 [Lithospermum erythrorhizon]|nr:hypothetical protein Leryth_022797 [Lithospermum erythrorhizon]
MNCRVNRSDPDAAVAPRRYGLDPLLPTPEHHSMSGIREDILNVTTPLVGGCAALPFDRYTVEEAGSRTLQCGAILADKAAYKKLAPVNRVGDFGQFPGFRVVLLSLSNSRLFQTIFAGASVPRNFGFLAHEIECHNSICILLLIGAVGKSAQIGRILGHLMLWRSHPVSALIHAATMVTAGVFMIASITILAGSVIYAMSDEQDMRKMGACLPVPFLPMP